MSALLLDSAVIGLHDHRMAEKGQFSHRVFVEDARENGGYLRATWHAERGVFVVSHWNADVCLAATQLSPADAGRLVGLLANGMGDALGLVSHQHAGASPNQTLWERLVSAARRVKRTARSEAVPLPESPSRAVDAEPRWREEAS
jgi:hypothetical protein